MNVPRLIILLMLLVEITVMGILSETRAFPTAMFVVTIYLYLRPFRIQFTQRQKLYLFLAATAFFATKMRMFPLEIHGRYSPFPNYDLSHALAQLLLVLQLLLLGMHTFSRREEKRLYSVHYLVPLMGILCIALISDFIAQNPFYRVTSMTGAGIFTVLFCIYIMITTTSATKSNGVVVKYLFSGIVLLSAITSGILLSLFAAPNVSKLDEFLFRYFQPNINTGSQGLSDQTTLQSVSALHNINTNRVALRVFSPTSPEYLRAHVRDSLKGRVWESNSPLKPLRPVMPPDMLKSQTGDNRFFQLRPSAGEAYEFFQVWSANYQSDLLFTTLNTAYVAAAPAILQVDEHCHCAVDGLPRSRPYLLFTGSINNNAPDRGLRKQCLQIPESLTDAARKICMEITQDQDTTAGKIRAVAHYFRSNYTYQYGIRIPAKQDPLSYFLTERPAAHCEYFASGAAIMLRVAGVPTRYVTGFVVTEKNASGGYWIARNKDAHAWVEAWDEQRGWVTMEATPPDGLPHSEPTSAFAAFRDMLKFKMLTVLAMIREQGINAIGEIFRQMLVAIFKTWPGRVLSGIALLGLVLYGLRKHPPHWRKQKLSPEEEAFRRLLSRVDKHATRYGFVRGQNETLQQFANRIHAEGQGKEGGDVLGNWYAACATLRCNGTPADETLVMLKRHFDRIINNTST